MMKLFALAISMALFSCSTAFAFTTPIPRTFNSQGEDRKAIQALLDNYTKAVSTQNQALLESLLLNKGIPFSAPSWAIDAKGEAGSTQNYKTFQKSVFEGEPFQQHFQDVTILQDGALAEVSLVFVNTTPKDSSWGWKTLQLLKVGGAWKIASEFFNAHR